MGHPSVVVYLVAPDSAAYDYDDEKGGQVGRGVCAQVEEHAVGPHGERIPLHRRHCFPPRRYAYKYVSGMSNGAVSEQPPDVALTHGYQVPDGHRDCCQYGHQDAQSGPTPKNPV